MGPSDLVCVFLEGGGKRGDDATHQWRWWLMVLRPRGLARRCLVWLTHPRGRDIGLPATFPPTRNITRATVWTAVWVNDGWVMNSQQLSYRQGAAHSMWLSCHADTPCHATWMPSSAPLTCWCRRKLETSSSDSPTIHGVRRDVRMVPGLGWHAFFLIRFSFRSR